MSLHDTGRSNSSALPWGATSGGLGRYLPLLWVVWLLFLFYPIEALFQSHPAPIRVGVVLTTAAIFSVVYVWNILRSLQRLDARANSSPWPALAVMFAIALALTIGDRRDWVELFIFVAVSMGPSLPPRRALALVAILVLLTPVLGIVVGATVIQVAQMMFQMGVSGIAVVIVVRTIVLERELGEARGEIARLAVNEERLRFARDLHDLLGHSLSLIALKSELAGRLATVDPPRAAAEMRDVEGAARTALKEVREAVAGYRQPTLSAELANAREILTAAGIEFEYGGYAADVPAAIEAVFSWAVREGVTNVIKHSRAGRCTIRLTRDGPNAVLQVRDDGRGASLVGEGSGLAGLCDRAEALGGRCETGSGPDGGFQMTVVLPAMKGEARVPAESRA